MSQENNNSAQKTFLRHTRLQGFRTVRDTEIDFQPGFNIIIGKNGTGKSNFLKFLQAAMALSLEAFPRINAFLEYSQESGETIGVEIEKSIDAMIKNGAGVEKTNLVNFKIFKNSSLQFQTSQTDEVYDFIDGRQFEFSTVFISHGLPANYYFVDTPLAINIDQTGFVDNLHELISKNIYSYFLKGLTFVIFWNSINLFKKKKNPTLKDIRAMLSDAFKLLEPVRKALELFDIQGLRINKNYNIIFNRARKEFSISNLYLEFKVNRQWLPFSHLSDGNRRLFYILSELFFPDLFQYQKTRMGHTTGKINKIILIEEPEVGLHPSHLDLLMQILKDESTEHQIIVTTHAPQLLDVLGKDDLMSITIARLSKSGTKLRHLNKKEQQKAALYMEEEAFLSDYWRYSDLED